MTKGAADRITSRKVFAGRVIEVNVDTVRFPDGSSGELEMIRHPGAAAIVPVLSGPGAADPEILLIRQYRYAAGGPIWEVPAGTLDAGESPEECARRELLEETGASASGLEHLTTIFTTPGFTDEEIHIFLATGLRRDVPSPDADEFLEVQPHPVSRVLEMIRSGDIRDAKTIVSVLYYAGFRLGL